MRKVKLEAGGRTISLSNLDKPLWPEVNVTKADLLHYMARVGPRLIPHLRGRPLTVVRFPDGIAGHGFYQKDAPNYTPPWISTYTTPATDKGRAIRYIVADDIATLIWLANQAAIELHPWLSRTVHPMYPDYAIIDLDPVEGAGFEEARTVAYAAWEWLQRLNLHAAVKTSGATGIHVVVPLEPIYPYSVTSRFVGLLAHLLKLSLPELVTTERTVSQRPHGTVYVDHLQNLHGKTIAAVYSPRPTARATVSAPFPWSMLTRVHPNQFTVKEPGAVLRHADDFDEILSRPQRIEQALEQLRSTVLVDA